MTPPLFDAQILGLLVAIVSAIAAIAVVKNVYLKYGLMVVIIVITIVLILKLNHSNNVYKTSPPKSEQDNAHRSKSKKTSKSYSGPLNNKVNKMDEALPVATDCQANANKKEEPLKKEEYRYKTMYFQNNIFIDLKGCRRDRDIVYCEIDIGNNDKEHSIKFYDVKDFSDTWATYIVDIKGNKHTPNKLNFTSAVEKVGWGRDAKYKWKLNNIIGLQFEYRNVHISISKIKQIYVAPEIFNANGVSEGKLVIDIPNILIY